jgi:mono/diheme cytochrome c family protein
MATAPPPPAPVTAAPTPPPAATPAPETISLFNSKCAACHGKDGRGQTKMGQKLRVRDLTDPAVQAKLADKALLGAITDGVKDDAGKAVMPAFTGKIADAQIKALAALVRGLR